MPTIDISRKTLEKLAGRSVNIEDLEIVKASLEEEQGDLIKIKLEDTNRPDLWSVEGIARAIKYYYKPGKPEIKAEKSKQKVVVDKNLEHIRPYISCFIARNVQLTDELLIDMIQLQEKLSENFGRKRQKVSIGLYDAKKMKFPLNYKAMPKEKKFIPLGFETEMTLKEILENHPKGKEYKHIIEHHNLFPLFFDMKGNVLALVPITNSATAGRLETGRTDILVENTSTDLNTSLLVSNILAYAFSDRGAKIEKMKILYPWKTKYGKIIETPTISKNRIAFDKNIIEKNLGLNLKDSQIKILLEKMMHKAKVGNKITVDYPSFRNDIMHTMDVVEDVAIAYGYKNIVSEDLKNYTQGKLHKETEFSEIARRLVIGMGFQEIMSPVLSSRKVLVEEMETNEETVDLENYMTESYSSVRNKILPSLLTCLTKNMHNEYSQKIFELGQVVVIDESSNTGTRTINNLACCISNVNLGYEDISSVLDALMKSLNIEYKLIRIEHPTFITGRVAEIRVGESVIGIIGEINPKVLNNFGLEKPVVSFEIKDII